MTRVEITRHAAADPAGVALLLAEPARRPTYPVPAGTVGRVRRTGAGFTADLQVTDGRGISANGTVTVVPAADEGCDLGVRIDAVEASAVGAVEAWVVPFLDGLAERARTRALAA